MSLKSVLRFLAPLSLIVLAIAVACSDHSSQTLAPPEAVMATDVPQVDDAILFLRFDKNFVDESTYDWPVSFAGTPGFR